MRQSGCIEDIRQYFCRVIKSSLENNQDIGALVKEVDIRRTNALIRQAVTKGIEESQDVRNAQPKDVNSKLVEYVEAEAKKSLKRLPIES